MFKTKESSKCNDDSVTVVLLKSVAETALTDKINKNNEIKKTLL